MSRFSALLALVLVLGAAVVAWKFLQGDPSTHAAESPAKENPPPDDEDSRIEGATSKAPSTEVPTVGDVQPTREQVTTPEEDDPDATWIVTGIARKGWKEPFPGVRLTAVLFEGREEAGEPIAEATLEADDEGNFAWPLHPPGSTVLVKIKGDEAGHYSGSATRVVFPGGEPPSDLEVRVYPLDVTIQGVVRGDGKPLAGAWVRTSSGETLTGEKGRYQLMATSVREEAMVYARAAGHAQARQIATTTKAGAVVPLDFDLVSSMKIRGRVVDEQGLPVEGATVKTFFATYVEAITDADGRYELDHLDPRRQNHHAYARKEGYVEASLQVEASDAETELADLVLGRGVRLEGIVLGDGGVAVPGAELYIGFSPSAYNRLNAVTDENGMFVFPAVSADSDHLFADAPGYRPGRQTVSLSKDRPVMDGVVVQMLRGSFVAGVAKYEDGEIPTLVSVSARHEGEYIDRRARLDAEGRFRLEGLPDKDLSLEFFGPGVLRHVHAVDAVDRDDLQVTLPRAGRVAGRVVDGATGEPLDEFTIRFVRSTGSDHAYGYSATWSREGHRFTATDGYWDSRDEELPPGGTLGIEARAEGYSPGLIGALAVELTPQADDHVIRMFPGGRVFGQVFDADRNPIANARIGIQPADNPNRYLSDEPYQPGISTTAEDGRFELPNSTPGDAVLLIQAPGAPMVVDGPFVVPQSGDAAERIIRLEGGGFLEGVLQSGSGEALGGETLTLYASEVPGVEHFNKETRTSPDGTFRFEGLPDGLYQVSHRVRKSDQTAHAMTLFARVQDGQSRPIQMRPSGTGSITGIVRHADGEQVPAVVPVSFHVTGTPDTPRELAPPMRATFAHEGRFEIRDLPPGSYRVSVTMFGKSRDFTSGYAQVELEEGGTAEAEVILHRQKR